MGRNFFSGCAGMAGRPVTPGRLRIVRLPLCMAAVLYPNTITIRIYGGKFMEFFNSAVDTLQTIVVGLGGALCVWGGVNLLEGYGADNPASNAHVQ